MKRAEETAFGIMMASACWPAAAFAEEAGKPSGGYAASDYDYVWFFMIGLILVYGVYDTVFITP